MSITAVMCEEMVEQKDRGTLDAFKTLHFGKVDLGQVMDLESPICGKKRVTGGQVLAPCESNERGAPHVDARTAHPENKGQRRCLQAPQDTA